MSRVKCIIICLAALAVGIASAAVPATVDAVV